MGETEVEQEISIETEIEKIVLAGMTGEAELKESVLSLAGLWGVESTAPKPLDIAIELQRLAVEYGKGFMEDSVRDEKAKAIVAKALTASDPLSTPL